MTARRVWIPQAPAARWRPEKADALRADTGLFPTEVGVVSGRGRRRAADEHEA